MKILTIIIYAFGLTLMAEDEGTVKLQATLPKCLAEVWCSKEGCDHVACDAVTNCSEEECPRHVDTLMLSKNYDINLTESLPVLKFSKTGDMGILFDDSIKFVNEGSTWLTIYLNDHDATSVPLNQAKWLLENVLIESEYKPIVRKYQDKWIIIFEK